MLNTDTYVQTVAPLAQDPTVRTAVANRLANELVARADVQGLATTAAEQLSARGAPSRLTDLVGPVVNGITSFLADKIDALLATEQFERAWQNVNRLAHESLVTVFTGGQTDVIASQGTTVTLDLGELLSLAKQQLVAQGFDLVSKVPDVSIPYTLVQSDQLPTVRTYTRLLNAAGIWLPWVALVLLVAGVLIAPNRRRGLVTGAVMLATVVGLLLFGMNEARTYYLDRLPSTIASPDAVAIIYDTVTRFLVASLQTLLVGALVVLVGALLAGPSRPAVFVRRLLNQGLDAGAAALTRAGGWVARTGRVLAGAHHLIQIGVMLLVVAVLIIAERPVSRPSSGPPWSWRYSWPRSNCSSAAPDAIMIRERCGRPDDRDAP